MIAPSPPRQIYRSLPLSTANESSRTLRKTVFLLLALAPRVGATTAEDICAPGPAPCIVSGTIRVDDGSLIDLGDRQLVIASGGALTVGSGRMSLSADRITVEDRGSLRAQGTASDAGGAISLTAAFLSIAGRVEASGTPGGAVDLTSTGELELTGAIDASSRTRDEDGGAITLLASSMNLAGQITANGGREGTGGDIDVSATGNLLLSRTIEASGGDGGGLTITAGAAAGSGTLTVTTSGRLEADALAADGFADAIDVTAEGDGVSTGHVILNGLISVSGTNGGDGGIVSVTADGDISAADRRGRITVNGGRPAGAGGEIEMLTTAGSLEVIASIEAMGDNEGRGGELTLDIASAVILGGSIDLTGGTSGGSASIAAKGDVTFDSTLRTDSTASGASVTVEGCTVLVNPRGEISSTGAGGVNRFIGRNLTVVRGTVRADAQTGRNEIVFGNDRRRPVIFDSATVIPAVEEIGDPALPTCGPLGTLTPTTTPSATRTPTRTATPRPSCAGDCNGGRAVTVNELITGVNIALGTAPLSACANLDLNANGRADINELIVAVNHALDGCPR